MRNKIIIGNWKMNNGPREGSKFVDDLENLMSKKQADVEWAIAAPFITIPYIIPRSHLGKEPFVLPRAAQNFYPSESGAFTGEVSLDFLIQIGVTYAIIGHSERREFFEETNELVNIKVKYALKKGVTPIMAFGETLKEFEAGKTLDVLEVQLKEGLKNISSKDVEKIILAYEPIWAIGTGKSLTPKEAQKVILKVREYIKKLFNEEASQKIRIQYGGSVNPKNIKELMKQPDIDGALVGNASLDADSFEKLIRYKNK